MEVDDRLLLPVLHPEIPRNPTVVFVHLAIPFPPAVELAAPDAEPLHEPPGADLGLLRLFCLSWKWRERSAVKITERTYEKDAETLHGRREGRHPEAAPAGAGADL